MDYGYVLKTSDKLGISIFHHRILGRYHNIYILERLLFIFIYLTNYMENNEGN